MFHHYNIYIEFIVVNMEMEKLMEKAVYFHGHSCPGLAIGVLASKYILEQGNDFSVDEELVAVVENDNCSVDAVQALLGTTFGKGNLKFLDYGKNNYTFYNRTNKKAVKLSMNVSSFEDRELSKQERIEKLLNSSPDAIFSIEDVEFKPPDEAQIHQSLKCQKCNQLTMSIRTKELNGKSYCIPCYDELTN